MKKTSISKLASSTTTINDESDTYSNIFKYNAYSFIRSLHGKIEIVSLILSITSIILFWIGQNTTKVDDSNNSKSSILHGFCVIYTLSIVYDISSEILRTRINEMINTKYLIRWLMNYSISFLGITITSVFVILTFRPLAMAAAVTAILSQIKVFYWFKQTSSYFKTYFTVENTTMIDYYK